MGTPEFAVAALAALAKSEHTIAGVVTAADKPAGRGGKMRASAVKQFCTAHNLKLWQPNNLKDPGFVSDLKEAQPDLFAVVAFRMLPAVVWQIPPLGTINLHASLLPDYRGAAPINWAIANGEQKTGVTTFFINAAIDTGDIIDQESVNITPSMNAGDLHDKLMVVGADLLVTTVDRIAAGNGLGKPQSEIQGEHNLHPAPKITKANSRIDWQRNTTEVINLIRGMAPYPGAHTALPDGTTFKIFRAVSDEMKLEPGVIAIDDRKALFVGTGNGSVSVLDLQMAGKRKMSIRDFLNGLPDTTALTRFI